MAENPHELSPTERQSWAAWAQTTLLDGVFRCRQWGRSEIAFQGGTCLHLVHGAPRFSEDIDFLLHPDREPLACMRWAVDYLKQQAVAAFGPEAPEIRLHVAESTEKGEVNPLKYEVRLTPPGKSAKVRLKVEFYRPPQADPLENYDTQDQVTLQPQLPSLSVRVRPATVTAASLQAIFRDKVVALATRRMFAVRDIFDLWWIHTQLPAKDRDVDRLLAGLGAHFAMYPNKDGAEAYLKVLKERAEALTRPEVVEEIRQAIPRWMDERSADLFGAKQVDEMVAYGRHVIHEALGHVKLLPPVAPAKKTKPKAKARPRGGPA